MEQDQFRKFEDYPLTRSEYISALVHLYRGELTRENCWRSRLDTSSNWAIIAVMGLLTYTFGEVHHSHAGILVAMFLALHFLVIEARRYRFYDIWRHRVRMLEENFYCPLLTRDLKSPEGNWGNLVAADLLFPRYKISYWQAFRARLLRNYLVLFSVLLVAWTIKLSIQAPEAVRPLWERAGVGPLPWWTMVIPVIGMYGWLLLVWLFVSPVRVDWTEEGTPLTRL